MDDKEKNILIRQEKENPDDWHVAAQGITPSELHQVAMNLAKKENTAFDVKVGGDVVGNNASYFIMNKDDFKNNE